MLSLHDLQSEEKAYRIVVPGTQGREFFIFENRQKKGWDSTLPGHGMLVWHIDEDSTCWFGNNVNTNANHQRIDIIEADGLETASSYASDPFPGLADVAKFQFVDWEGNSLFGFDYVEETDSIVSCLLSDTGFKPAAPGQIDVIDIRGRHLSFTWLPSEDARQYIVSVKDEAGNAVKGFDGEIYLSADTVSLSDLVPETRYVISVTSAIGSYRSDTIMHHVTMLPLQFSERKPIVAEPSNVSGTGFTLAWQPVEGLRVIAWGSSALYIQICTP